jgi:hypothetical protein
MYTMPRKKERRGGLSRSFLVVAVLCCLGFVWAGSAHADLSMQLTGVPGTSWGGAYTGPYQVTVNGTPMSLVCDDYTQEITQGATWNATMYSGSNVSSLKFASGPWGNGAPTATQAYQEVFWLSSQLMNATDPNAISAIHYGIWAITDPTGVTSVPNNGGTGSTSYWLNLAGQSQNYGSVNMANYSVYVPSSSTPSQEFIGVNQSPVPLPPSVMLMGTGLIGVVGLRKRLRRKTAWLPRRMGGD